MLPAVCAGVNPSPPWGWRELFQIALQMYLTRAFLSWANIYSLKCLAVQIREVRRYIVEKKIIVDTCIASATVKGYLVEPSFTKFVYSKIKYV